MLSFEPKPDFARSVRIDDEPKGEVVESGLSLDFRVLRLRPGKQLHPSLVLARGHHRVDGVQVEELQIDLALGTSIPVSDRLRA